MSKTYTEKLNNITDWVRIVNHYWQELQGDLYNNKEFWRDSLHAMTNEDWWDWVDIMPALQAQHPDTFRKYSSIQEDTKEINKKLLLGKTIVKPNVSGKNFEAFRALMNIKDIMNDIAGTPTIDYKKKSKIKPTPPHIKEPARTTFHDLFDIEYK